MLSYAAVQTTATVISRVVLAPGSGGANASRSNERSLMIRLALTSCLAALALAFAPDLFAQNDPTTRPDSRPVTADQDQDEDQDEERDPRREWTQEEREAQLDLVIPKHDEASYQKDEASGVAWSWLKRGPETGEKLLVGDKVRAHMTVWIAADGSEVSTSRRRDGRSPRPEVFDSGAFVRGLNVVTPHLRPGDKVRIDLPAKAAFGEKGIRNRIPPDADLIYALQILRVEGHVDVPPLGPWDDARATVLEDGSAYMILADGKGAIAGDKAGVAFDYVMRDEKGNIIDSSLFSLKAPLGGQAGRFGPAFLNAIAKIARTDGHYRGRVEREALFKGEVSAMVDPDCKILYFDLLAREVVPFVHADDARMEKTANGLEYLIIRPGEGEKVKPEDRVHIHYAYWTLPDGQLFDSSYTRGVTNNFKQVGLTPGMRQALAKIAPGGMIRARIPASLAWGAAGRVGVPGNTDILLQVELFPQDAPREDPRGQRARKRQRGNEDGEKKGAKDR